MRASHHRPIAFAGLVASLLLFVWIPLDTDTGLVERVRRQVVIGDALAPSIAALFLLLGSVVMLLEKHALEATDNKFETGFIVRLVLLLSASLLLMRYTGDVVVAALNTVADTNREYRLLRDSVPWKYSGSFLGGTVLVLGVTSLVEGRLRLSRLLLAAIAVTLLLMLFDLPFDDLLLPPNGDV